MGKVTVVGGKVGMDVPVGGISLAEIAEGSIVKLNENGKSVQFYVAKHNYESSLNGTGRTLLVRRSHHSSMLWNSTDSTVYSTCSLNEWLNGTYKNTLDEAVRTAIGTTSFYCLAGNKNPAVITLSRSVFVLSAREITNNVVSVTAHGTLLPIASTLRSYPGNSAWWTRSAYDSTKHVVSISALGNQEQRQPHGIELSVRPCFTLPSNALFDETTMVFKGVA